AAAAAGLTARRLREMKPMRSLWILAGLTAAAVLGRTALSADSAAPSPDRRQAALAAFSTVQKGLPHPRCHNCPIPGDAPLQFDAGLAPTQNVLRGQNGTGAPGLGCATCHGTVNTPASYGAHMPPGAPGWRLPPPNQKMVFIGLSASDLCATVKDPQR